MTGSPVSTIRNLGPAMQEACTRAGIPDAETLRALGADEAYARLLASGHRPHFIGYYVLHMALQGRPWNDCHGAEKAKLRQSFERIKAAIHAPPGDSALPGTLAQALDRLGVVPPSKEKP